MCNQSSPSHGALDASGSCTEKQGRKRKHDEVFCDIYVPPKRISPFLNTPKEKKEERRKILKMSIKKLKQLEDPETFLRRTVLVNNTRKRIQLELKEEKANNRKSDFKSRSCGLTYDVLSNGCLSNSYLIDDPFLSGIHEKITDDMTDTLINNLKDKLCDNVEIDTKSAEPSVESQKSSERLADDTNRCERASNIEKGSGRTNDQAEEVEAVTEAQCIESDPSSDTDDPMRGTQGSSVSSYSEMKVDLDNAANEIPELTNSTSNDSSVSEKLQEVDLGQFVSYSSNSLSENSLTVHTQDRVTDVSSHKPSAMDQGKENTDITNNTVTFNSSAWDLCCELEQELSKCVKSGCEAVVRETDAFQFAGNKILLAHSMYTRPSNFELDQQFQMYNIITGKEL